MAQMRGLGFKKGNLGDINFRQQVVKVKNGYAKRTVASQKIETNSSNTVRQAKQRSKFRLVQQLATALSAKGILRNFYQSVTNLPGYQMFVKDHLTGDKAIHISGGQNFLDFKKVMVTKGGKAKNVKAYAVTDADETTGQRVSEDGCHCEMKLAWNYSYLNDGDGANWVLQLVGVKIAEDGSIEEILHEQPLATMNQCSVDVKLPYCNCCKTYWYGFFVNAVEGRQTTSKYFGTCSCELPVYDDTCMTCEDIVRVASVITPPSDCADGSCNEGEGVDPASIIYNGTSQIQDDGNGELTILIPNGASACNLDVAATAQKFDNSTFNVSADFTVSSTADGASAAISIASTALEIKDAITAHLTEASFVSVTAGADSDFDVAIQSIDSISGLAVTDSATSNPIAVFTTSKVRLDYTASPLTAELSVSDSDSNVVASGTGTAMLITDAGTESDYSVTVSSDGCDDVKYTYRLAASGDSVTRVVETPVEEPK